MTHFNNKMPQDVPDKELWTAAGQCPGDSGAMSANPAVFGQTVCLSLWGSSS